MPTVSVIITTHNRPHLLSRAIKSAREAGKDVEVVVVDDASTDETADVCRSLSDIRYVRVERNQKVAAARNIGVLVSRGEYITFLDDDDARLAGSLDLQLEALAAVPQAGLIYGQALVANQSNMATGDYNPKRCPQGDVFWELLGRNFIPCGTALFRRSCLFRAGLLDQSVPGIDDWDLWVRISALYEVIALKQPVILWRRSTPASGQGTSRANELVAMATRQFKNKWIKLARAADAPDTKRREVWQDFSKNMATHLALETARTFKYGNFLCAPKNLVTAASLHPWGSIRLATSPSTFVFVWTAARRNFSGTSRRTLRADKHVNDENYH